MVVFLFITVTMGVVNGEFGPIDISICVMSYDRRWFFYKLAKPHSLTVADSTCSNFSHRIPSPKIVKYFETIAVTFHPAELK